MKIIFLDIDGVLNSEYFYVKKYRNMKELRLFDLSLLNENNELVHHLLHEIDLDNLDNLKEIVNKTNSLIVVTSSWKKLNCYEKVRMRLIGYGLPIIGKTYDNGENRGYGIKNYIKNHKVENYVVLDGEIFPDYDEEIIDHLVKTNFYDGGLDRECTNKAIEMLNKNYYLKKTK